MSTPRQWTRPIRIGSSIAAALVLLFVLLASLKAFFSPSRTARGQRVYPVQGQVLCAGRPAVGARVVFHSKGNTETLCPSGTVDDDGSFRLTTYEPEDGAPAGEYSVVVIWPRTGSGKRIGGQDRLRGHYSNAAHSPLHARIEETDNYLPPFGVH
jgi:hypothetical protein